MAVPATIGVLSVIRDQASVDHRYWCIFYLAVMANKCGVSYDELEDDAYGLLDRFDALSVEPSNRFTANDVAVRRLSCRCSI